MDILSSIENLCAAILQGNIGLIHLLHDTEWWGEIVRMYGLV